MRWITAAVLFSVLPAQSVHVVDAAAGPIMQIQAAVDAAVDGDLILVRSGLYGQVTINAKSLTIMADVGAQVRTTSGSRSGTVSSFPSFPSACSTSGPSPSPER